MFSKFLSIAGKMVTVVPKIVSDLESDVSKIKADPTLSKKIMDGLATFDQLLTDILGAL